MNSIDYECIFYDQDDIPDRDSKHQDLFFFHIDIMGNVYGDSVKIGSCILSFVYIDDHTLKKPPNDYPDDLQFSFLSFKLTSLQEAHDRLSYQSCQPYPIGGKLAYIHFLELEEDYLENHIAKQALSDIKRLILSQFQADFIILFPYAFQWFKNNELRSYVSLGFEKISSSSSSHMVFFAHRGMSDLFDE